MPVITISAVNTGTEELTAVAHGLLTGDRFRVRNVGGALPASTPSLAPVTDYFAVRTGVDTLKVAVSSANALAGTPVVDLTGAGSGTNLVEYGLPYCIPTALAAAATQIKSANDNAAWNALVALYDLLTGQAQAVWATVSFAVAFIALTVDGVLRLGTTASGIITPTAFASSTVNDYNPTGLAGALIIRQADTGGSTVNGLAGGVEGRIIVLENIGTTAGTDQITLNHENGGSTAANRFLLPNNAAAVIRTNASATLRYDATSSRWRLIALS